MALTKKQQLHAVLQQVIDSYRAGDLRKAVAFLSANARRFPTAPKLWGYLGFLFAEFQDYSRAVVAYKNAVRLSPHSELASLGLFHNLWRLGKTDAAFDEMRRFVKANDSDHYRHLIRDMLADVPGKQVTSSTFLIAV